MGLKLPRSLVERMDAERPPGMSRTAFVERAIRSSLGEVPAGFGETQTGRSLLTARRVLSSAEARAGVRPVPKGGKR